MAELTSLKIVGQKRLRRKMQLLPKKIRKEMAKLLNDVGTDTVNDIRSSILRSSGSFKSGPKGHWSSPPGTPPNKITGDLARSVKKKQRAKINDITMEIDVDAEYGKYLEFGTFDGRIAARPFMRPGFRRNSPRFTKGGKKILKKVPKKVGKS